MASERLNGFIERLNSYAQADSVSRAAVDALFRPLFNIGLDRWADVNPAGGGVDTLALVLMGEKLPEPEPMTEGVLLEALFG